MAQCLQDSLWLSLLSQGLFCMALFVCLTHFLQPRIVVGLLGPSFMPLLKPLKLIPLSGHSS